MENSKIIMNIIYSAGSGDYETVYSGTFCRQNSNSSSENSEANTKATPLAAPSSQPQHQRSLTIQSATATTVTQMNEVQRSALKKNLLLQQASMSAASGESSHNPGYDFHRAIERLVEKMDLVSKILKSLRFAQMKRNYVHELITPTCNF